MRRPSLPQPLPAPLEQLNALAREGIPSLTHSIIILSRPEQPRMTDADREGLWWAFRVPVFEQVIGKFGKLLAAECEAHDGLHVVSPALSLHEESLDDSLCPCGRKSPRIAVTHKAIAAYAR